MSGGSSGVFVDPVVPAGTSVHGVGTSHLSWNASTGFHWGSSSGGATSRLDFLGSAIRADLGDPFSVGTLAYSPAGSVPAQTGLLITVALASLGSNLELGLGLTLAPGAGGPGLAGPLPQATFSLDGAEYTLEITGLQSDPAGWAWKDGFFGQRQIAPPASLLARISASDPVTLPTGSTPNGAAPTVTPTPEPDSALLYLVGLALVGTRLRRRRS